MLKRIEYKKTLIDTVIIRVDYPGTIIHLPDTIRYIKPILEELGFKEMRKGRVGQGQINVDLKDPTQPPKIEFTSQSGDNYFFFNDIYEIQVNETYVMYIAKLNKKLIRFTDYYQHMLKVLTAIRAGNSNLLGIVRIGLQKINVLYKDDPSYRYTYFNENVFPKSVLEEYNESLVMNNNLENYINEQCNVNFGRHFDNGIIVEKNEEKLVYRFVLDIDAYVAEQNNHEMITQINNCVEFEKEFDSILVKLNNVIFKFFENSCTDELKEFLTK